MNAETGEFVALFLIILLVGYCVLMRKFRIFGRRMAKRAEWLEELWPELREHGVTGLNCTWSPEVAQRHGEGAREEAAALVRKVLDAHKGKGLPRTLHVTGKSMGHPLIEKLTLERIV